MCIQQEKRRPMSSEEEKLFGIDKLNIRRSEIPAVTHVDYSARIQTVHLEDKSPLYHSINQPVQRENRLWGILVNTSFNVRGEPIVCTPEDAFKCFMGTEIEMLVIGNCVLRKEQQDKLLAESYKYREGDHLD